MRHTDFSGVVLDKIDLQPGLNCPPYSQSHEPGNVFYFSGDLGDTVFANPAIKALGGGHLVLGPDNRSGMETRERMTEFRAGQLYRLMKAQPWIKSVSYSDSLPTDTTHDLNDFRHLLRKGRDLAPGMNLARVFLECYGLDLNKDSEPFLEGIPLRKISNRPVVIARSPRYNNSLFPWAKLLRSVRDKAVFVGLPDEHAAFCAAYGDVDYAPTKDLYDLASIIAGSELFVGNQSCANALAEALKKDTLLELDRLVSNCLFSRKNASYSLKECRYVIVRQRARKEVTIGGPVGAATGFDQLVVAVAKEFSNQGIDTRIAADGLSKDYLDAGVVSKLGYSGTVDLRIVPLLWAPKCLKSGEILFTMWEATKLPSDVVQVINDRAACVAVPSIWNMECFKDSGVVRPLYVVPLGIDPKEYYRIPMSDQNLTVFGIAGKQAHGGARKGLFQAINLFVNTFHSDENVRLKVKISRDCDVEHIDDPRIDYIREFLDVSAMRSFYSSLTCFVSLARAEGWGLHQHQAMAVGRPVIAAAYGALSEFLDSDVGYPVDYHTINATGADYRNYGCWCLPKEWHAAKIMKHVVKNHAEVKRKGDLAAKRALEFTWKNTADKLMAVLSDYERV